MDPEKERAAGGAMGYEREIRVKRGDRTCVQERGGVQVRRRREGATSRD